MHKSGRKKIKIESEKWPNIWYGCPLHFDEIQTFQLNVHLTVSHSFNGQINATDDQKQQRNAHGDASKYSDKHRYTFWWCSSKAQNEGPKIRNK